MHTRNFLSFAAVAALLALSVQSCTKTGNKLFEGYYSYKLSGTLEVERSPLTSPDQPQDTVTITLPNESGQMYILNMDNGSGNMLVTMNALAGSVNKMEARPDNNSLIIESAERHQNILHDGTSLGFKFEVSGSGKKYDDVVIFDLNYGGQTEGTLYLYRILGSSIECVAREN